MIKRQAVVIIHGIGEQRPMETLRGFVDSILPNPLNQFKAKFFVKPDELSESFELRRITVPKNDELNHPKTDFYEYYWANLMDDTSLDDSLSWMLEILKNFKKIPKRLIVVYFFLLFIAISFIGLLVIGYIFRVELKSWFSHEPFTKILLSTGAFFLLKIVGSLIVSQLKFITTNIIGDAARYFKPKPRNISKRQQIRTNGLKLLRKLHGENSFESSMYDRIVVVGHSLGSVIAYDLITILWSFYHNKFHIFHKSYEDKLKETEKFLKESEGSESEDFKIKFRDLQKELFELSNSTGNPWKITDFLTLGSPLSHAQLLIAEGKESLEQLHQERTLPTCPPTLEKQGTLSFNNTYFDANKKEFKFRTPHHAALFAFTRWTNIWFTKDFVGGPMQEAFGKGIEDIELKSITNPTVPFLSHTHYWHAEEKQSVEYIKNVIFPQV